MRTSNMPTAGCRRAASVAFAGALVALAGEAGAQTETKLTIKAVYDSKPENQQYLTPKFKAGIDEAAKLLGNYIKALQELVWVILPDFRVAATCR